MPQLVTTAAPTVSPEEWDAWRAFLDMRRVLDLTLERQLQRDADLSSSEFSVLVTLFETPDRRLRVGEIGAALAWEKSRVSHQVSRMERRKLVERQLCDSDARGTWVQLTADGSRAVLGAIRPHSATLRRYVFDALSPEQLAALGDISATLLGGLERCTPADVENE
jgi:DNA-binding MarR family transcriptional regulator